VSEVGASRAAHLPVMLNQVLRCLEPAGKKVLLDCTLGLGGHAEAIFRSQDFEGKLIGIDRDRQALSKAEQRLAGFGDRFQAIQGTFGRLGELLEAEGCASVDGVLFDLGVSSLQLDQAGRGFSFKREGPLDMRMDQQSGRSALDLVAELDVESLEVVIRDYGEERHSRRVAKAIVRERDRKAITSTSQLAEIVRKVVGGKSGRIDPATRTFQALRIAVNDELNQLQQGLVAATEVLAVGGRLAVISFHSLEDRIAKRFMRSQAKEGRAQLINRKPMVASEDEKQINPRARSAKLRAMEILGSN
jgi:16S rRNA (cytosine1402-N4)-methyltransferase